MPTPSYIGYGPPFLTAGGIVMPLQTDERLIKNDVLQLLFTRKGERRGRPNYGTDIEYLLGEPNDDADLDDIRTDIIQQIQATDERVIVRDLIISRVIGAHEVRVYLIMSTVNNPLGQFDLEVFVGKDLIRIGAPRD